MKKKFIYTLFFLFSNLLLLSNYTKGQNKIEDIENIKLQIEIQKTEIQQLRNQINSDNSQLNQKLNSYASSSMVLFLFGAFCALWAQDTGRNPWSWFFLGLFFSMITVIILLIKGADDIKN